MVEENVIVSSVEISQAAELCEVFRNNFSSTLRNDEGNDHQLNNSAISRRQHFTISAKDVHRQIINLNPNPVLHAIWLRLWQNISITHSRLASFWSSGNRQLFVQLTRRVARTMLQTTGRFAQHL